MQPVMGIIAQSLVDVEIGNAGWSLPLARLQRAEVMFAEQKRDRRQNSKATID